MDSCSEMANSRGFSIGAVIGMAVPISMIAMGGVHLNDCPAERYIPVYLIVAGCFGIILGILKAVVTCTSSERDAKATLLLVCLGIISVFVLAWFIAGNVWIYRLHGKYSTDPAAPNYCDNTFYLFAFWVTTTGYIMIGVSILLCCCLSCCCRNK